MQIRHKLILGLTGICLLVGAVGLNALINNRRTQRHVRELNQFPIALNEGASGMANALVSSQKAAQELMSESQRGLLEPDEKADSHEAAKEAEESLTTHLAEFQQHLAAARATVQADLQASSSQGGDADELDQEQDELKMLDDIEAEFVAYRNHLIGFIALAKSDVTDADETLEDHVEPHYNRQLLPIVKTFKVMIEYELAREHAGINDQISGVSRILIVSTIGALIFAILLGFYISRSISHPIRKLTNAAVEIGKGRLETRIDVNSNDELGTLAEAFNQMATGLANTTISKGFLDSILTSMTDSLVVLNKDMTIEKVNQATLNLLGFEESELKGKDLKLIIADKSCSDVSLDEFNKKGFIRNADKTYLAKDGREISMSFSASVMRGSDGLTQGIVCVAHDITERKQVEDAIREKTVALENAAEGIARLDCEGRYVSANQAYAGLVGYDSQEMIGMEWSMTVHVEDREKLAAAYQHMLDNGRVEVEAKGRAQRRLHLPQATGDDYDLRPAAEVYRALLLHAGQHRT